ncbi:MAG: hypothetical protein K0Q57_855 [Gammaproteobacteria bacterium]|nr:hypothetical protein [Gammaproteobacteria bacterium]
MPNAFTDKPSLNTLVSGQDMPEIAGRVLTFLDGASLSQYAQSAKSPSEIAKKQWALNVKEHLISDDSSLTAIPHGQEKDFYTSIYQRYIKTAESLLQNRSILREKFVDEEGRTFRKRSILHIIWYVGLNQLFTQLLTKVIHEYRTTEVLKAELNTALFEANFDAPSLLALAAENNSISIFHLLSEDELRRTANDPNIFRSARSLELSALLLKYHANPVAQIKNSDFLASIIKSQNLKLLQHVLAQFSPEERSDILKTEEGAVSFLHLAAETGNQAIFMEVLKTIPKEERARPLLRKTSDQENLLHAAAKYGNGAFVKGIATLMAEAQAQGRGEGQVEACRKEFLRQLSTRNYSPIDIAAGSNNDQALSLSPIPMGAWGF